VKFAPSDIRLFRVFDAVVRHNGFAAAQFELNISPSTISNHITALEERIGIRLCQRGRSGFRLTEAGSRAHFLFRQFLESLDKFNDEIGSINNQMIGRLRLGVVDAVVSDSAFPLDRAIRLFEERSNSVFFDVEYGLPQNLQMKISSGDLDIAIGSFPFMIPEIYSERLYTEKHFLYCSSEHRFFSLKDCDISPDEITKENSVSRKYWRSSHTANRSFYNIKASVENIEHQLVIIMSGHYIGYLPEHIAIDLVRRKTLRKLRPDIFYHDSEFSVIAKPKKYRRPIVDSFMDDLRAANELKIDSVRAGAT
jgi:LysR family transcriptional regulator, transcriptional activator for bauABCD operon